MNFLKFGDFYKEVFIFRVMGSSVLGRTYLKAFIQHHRSVVTGES